MDSLSELLRWSVLATGLGAPARSRLATSLALGTQRVSAEARVDLSLITFGGAPRASAPRSMVHSSIKTLEYVDMFIMYIYYTCICIVRTDYTARRYYIHSTAQAQRRPPIMDDQRTARSGPRTPLSPI